MTSAAPTQSTGATLPQEPDNREEPMDRLNRLMGMNGKSPLFITASLLIATLSVALPDLDLETVTETQARKVATQVVGDARKVSSPPEAKS
jgi:hypothetical protein